MAANANTLTIDTCQSRSPRRRGAAQRHDRSLKSNAACFLLRLTSPQTEDSTNPWLSCCFGLIVTKELKASLFAAIEKSKMPWPALENEPGTSETPGITGL